MTIEMGTTYNRVGSQLVAAFSELQQQQQRVQREHFGHAEQQQRV